MRATLIAMTLLTAAQLAHAEPVEVISHQVDSVSVTIYRDLFALITETRTVDLPEGPVKLSFDGVVETLLPESAVASDAGRALEERNFDYDPLSPNNLLAKSIGKSVTITRTLPGAGRVIQTRAVIVAANDQGITLHTDSGNEALHCSGLPEQLTFEEIPDALHAKPRLSIHLAAGQAGKRTIRLSYLAHGFAWKSDYVARLNRSGTRMDLTGWITLHNHTAANLRGAQVQVVAGQLHLVSREEGGSSLASDDFYDDPDMQDTRDEARDDLNAAQLFSGCYAGPVPPERTDRKFEKTEEIVVTGYRSVMMNSAVSVAAIREELGDYQLYRLPWATDLNARQTKQAVFLTKPRVKIERYYSYLFDAQRLQYLESFVPSSMLRFENRKSWGLGEPLPSGTVRVFETSDDTDLFVGESSMLDKPVNLPVELDLAKAIDLAVSIGVDPTAPEVLRQQRLAYRADVELRALNAKGVPVTLEVLQQYDAYTPNTRILNASQRAGRKDGNFAWRLRVPANGTQLLTYRLEMPKEAESAAGQ